MSLKYPYLVLSDVHFHDWTFGSYTNPDNVNSRLADTIKEFLRAVATLEEQGGKDIVITGDLFHTRGEIKPTVYNPVYDMFKDISERGFRVHALPGNHDLETEETTEEGCCFKTFSSLEGFKIYYSTVTLTNFDTKEKFTFIPWTERFRGMLISVDIRSIYRKTIFAHVGISGVVNGLKGVINANEFTDIEGLRYVFSGHYHNHKRFDFPATAGEPSVFSVGALTHQSFKDVGSTAGFIIVERPEKVTFHNSQAPEFVDFDDDDFMSTCPYPEKFENNFVRIKTDQPLTKEEILATKILLESTGALRVINRAETVNLELGEMINPTEYIFGKSKSETISNEFKNYIKSRYDKAMADCLIDIFEKDGIDEH